MTANEFGLIQIAQRCKAYRDLFQFDLAGSVDRNYDAEQHRQEAERFDELLHHEEIGFDAVAKYVEDISRLFLLADALLDALVRYGQLIRRLPSQLKVVGQVELFCVLERVSSLIRPAIKADVVAQLLRLERYLILTILRHGVFLVLGLEYLYAVQLPLRANLLLLLLLPLKPFQDGKQVLHR